MELTEGGIQPVLRSDALSLISRDNDIPTISVKKNHKKPIRTSVRVHFKYNGFQLMNRRRTVKNSILDEEIRFRITEYRDSWFS